MVTVNTTNITGYIVLPNDTIRERSSVIFTMNGFDTDADDNATVVPVPIVAAIDTDGSIDQDLWPNPDGVRTTFYRVTFSMYNGTNPILVDGGLIEVPATGGPYDLNDLLPIEPPSGATVAEYIAQLAAAVAEAVAAADSAAVDAADAAVSAAEAALYDGVWLDDVADLVADTALTYTASQPGTVFAGDIVQTQAEGFSYEVAASGATDEHLETAGGVKLTVIRDVWSAEAFGVVPDGDVTGSTGTDNSTALLAMIAAIQNESRKKFTFPRGVIISETALLGDNDVNVFIDIEGYGSRLLFKNTSATVNQRFMSLRQTGMDGESISIRGLQFDLARNPLRTAGSDMLSIGGFDDMRAVDLVIPSADNVAIAVNRNLTHTPESVEVTGCRIGGKPPVTGVTHDYGSIGDTGIWITNHARSNIVTSNHIRSTGDDAIAVAETQSTDQNSVAVISGNTARDVQGSAFKSAAAYTVATGNRAQNTLADMYRILDLASGSGSTVPKQFTITGGQGKDIGEATLANLGVGNLIASSHKSGVHIQDAEGQGSIVGLHLTNTKEEAFKFTTSARNCAGVEIKDCVMDQIGGAGEAVFVRSGDATYTLTDISFEGNTVRNSQSRMLAWECSLTTGAEGGLLWRNNDFIGCDFSGDTEIIAFAGTGASRLENINIEGDELRSCTAATSRVVDIGAAPRDEFNVSVNWNGRKTSPLTAGAHLRSANSNCELIGTGSAWDGSAQSSVRLTVASTREFNDVNTLMALDPEKNWEVLVTGARNSTATFNNLRYDAKWESALGQLVYSDSTSGGPSSDCAVELVEVTPDDPQDQVFSGSTILQLQGTTTGWTSDPTVRVELFWREITDDNLSAAIT